MNFAKNIWKAAPGRRCVESIYVFYMKEKTPVPPRHAG
jgi:hypothetical protein